MLSFNQKKKTLGDNKILWIVFKLPLTFYKNVSKVKVVSSVKKTELGLILSSGNMVNILGFKVFNDIWVKI
jgi:hypothetical protein